MERLIPASERTGWREALAPLGEFDATFLPEYHLAYALRIQNSSPLLWNFERGGEHFVYPFLLTPVVLEGRATPYFDITGIYGYTGPLTLTDYERFQDVREQLKKEGVNITLPTGN